MASYNRVILVGNLTKDIELRYTPGGTAVADVSIAVNDRRKSASGEWVEEVTFVDVTMWGRTAEVASEYLGKGSPILVEGRLKMESWETDGQKRSKLKVVCDRMQMLSGPSGGSGPSNSPPRPQQNSAPTAAPSQPSPSPATGGDTNQATASGQREAQPTSGAAGYDDADIPF